MKFKNQRQRENLLKNLKSEIEATLQDLYHRLEELKANLIESESGTLEDTLNLYNEFLWDVGSLDTLLTIVEDATGLEDYWDSARSFCEKMKDYANIIQDNIQDSIYHLEQEGPQGIRVVWEMEQDSYDDDPKPFVIPLPPVDPTLN